MQISNSISVWNNPPSVLNVGGTSYLLDTYSALAAYSLRQLKTGVTNVVRVRRSSDNAESDFTADEITDGTLTTWTGANDGFVVKLYDQVSTNDATQSTAANQAKIVSSGTLVTDNTKPAMDFDGSGDSLVVGTIGLSGSTLRSVFAVCSLDTLPAVGGGYLGVGTLGGAGTVYDLCPESGRFALRVSGNSIYNTTISTSNQYLFTTLQTTTTTAGLNLFIDGSSITQTSTTTTTLNTNDDWYIGRTPNETKDYMDGKIQEIIIYNSDQTGNRTSIETDINDHYSIY